MISSNKKLANEGLNPLPTTFFTLLEYFEIQTVISCSQAELELSLTNLTTHQPSSTHPETTPMVTNCQQNVVYKCWPQILFIAVSQTCCSQLLFTTFVHSPFFITLLTTFVKLQVQGPNLELTLLSHSNKNKNNNNNNNKNNKNPHLNFL